MSYNLLNFAYQYSLRKRYGITYSNIDYTPIINSYFSNCSNYIVCNPNTEDICINDVVIHCNLQFSVGTDITNSIVDNLVTFSFTGNYLNGEAPYTPSWIYDESLLEYISTLEDTITLRIIDPSVGFTTDIKYKIVDNNGCINEFTKTYTFEP